MVPGHEITGIAKMVGSNVTSIQVNDKVGIGCYVDSCRVCVPCKYIEKSFYFSFSFVKAKRIWNNIALLDGCQPTMVQNSTKPQSHTEVNVSSYQ